MQQVVFIYLFIYMNIIYNKENIYNKEKEVMNLREVDGKGWGWREG